MRPDGAPFKVCLGIPARVTQIDAASQGKVDYLGTKVRVDFTLLENIRPGDWVIVHAGFAIARLDEEEARETLDLLREIAERQGE
jgi:hydrogenase expression/formation protein HypC